MRRCHAQGDQFFDLEKKSVKLVRGNPDGFVDLVLFRPGLWSGQFNVGTFRFVHRTHAAGDGLQILQVDGPGGALEAVGCPKDLLHDRSTLLRARCVLQIDQTAGDVADVILSLSPEGRQEPLLELPILLGHSRAPPNGTAPRVVSASLPARAAAAPPSPPASCRPRSARW